MSFGSLSGNAVEALNRGAAMAGCLQNTGEGALAPYHRNGGEIVFQIGTSYFGCRDEHGNFDLSRLKDVVASAPVRAIEIKLSQGAKPGLGGMLPAAKITREIAEIRGIPMGKDCASPEPAPGLRRRRLDARLRRARGHRDRAAGRHQVRGRQPRASGTTWSSRCRGSAAPNGRGVDFVNIDGGEGGTGAAPLVFADSVAFPFRIAFTQVYSRFARAGLTDDVVFIGGGKLGLPESAVVAFALGADGVQVGREAMFALGCIQAQKCHTDECPTGVATQKPRLVRGLDPDDKSERVKNYVIALRRDLLKVSEAVGVPHPGLIGPDDVDLAQGLRSTEGLRATYGYEPGLGRARPRAARGDHRADGRYDARPRAAADRLAAIGARRHAGRGRAPVRPSGRRRGGAAGDRVQRRGLGHRRLVGVGADGGTEVAVDGDVPGARDGDDRPGCPG